MTKKLKDFKNIYSINKTLRFSLIPDKKTAEFLDFENEKKENFEKDRKIAKNYKILKEILNEVHQDFIQKSMKDFKFSQDELKNFEKVYLELLNFTDKDNFEAKKKLKTKYESARKVLTKKIATHFSKFKPEDNKKFTFKNITKKEVFDILEEKYKDDKEKSKIIHTFSFQPTKEEKKLNPNLKTINFTTYLTGFNQNRENFYKGEDKAGQFATRTVDNLVQFIKNKKTFEDKYQENYKTLDILDEQTKIFSIDCFNNLFLQDNLDQYNGVIGNKKVVENKTNDGINQKINIFRQNEKKNFNKSDFPLFKELYKQIGSIRKDRKKNDVYIEIKNDEELVKELNSFPENVENYVNNVQEFYKDFFEKLQNDEYDLDKIYLPKSVGTYFSHTAFSDWNKLAFIYDKRYKNEKVKITEEGDINVQYRSLEVLKNRFNELKDDNDLKFNKFFIEKLKFNTGEKENIWYNFWRIIQFSISSQFIGGEKEVLDKTKNEITVEKINSIGTLKNKYLKAVQSYKEKMVDSEIGLTDNEEKEIKENIKNYLDRIKEIERIAKYFDLKKYFQEISESDKDVDFYDKYQEIINKTEETKINTYYNEFRNYLTQNNIIEEKIKLNFDKVTLLDGWPTTMERANLSVIFRDKITNKFFLGIINSKDTGILDRDINKNIFIESSFQKMEYIQISDVSQEIQNLMVVDGRTVKKNGRKDSDGINRQFEELKNTHLPEDINAIRKNKSYSVSSENFNRDDLNSFIDFYKQRIIEYKKGVFEFTFKETSKYTNFKDFTDHISTQDYKVNFVGIDKNYIGEKVKNGELYLFQIYNKDFSEHKKEGSTDNLETIYFKELFSKENLENPVFKLSGGAEMFFRDKIEKKREKKKNDNNGKEILDKRRFSENKILFHFPVEINYGKGKAKNFNQEVNTYISKNSEDIKIIGIDRGEKHLLYYSIIDQKGNNIKSDTLNIINGVDYHQKLDQLEKERQNSRKSWQNIDKIKNLKKGYLSFVVKKIVDLAIENNAIIILEDLNFGFKSFRQKIEKNVYQQFEKALIDKLGFVVDKQKQNQRFAPQLSAPFESFEKIKKQTGIVYYVLAANTSKVCPSCQWIKNIYPKYEGQNTISNLQKNYKMKVFFENDRFRFEYEKSGEKISVFSDMDRQRYDKTKNQNKGSYIEYKNDNSDYGLDRDGVYQEKSLSILLKELFEENKINLDKEILQQLVNNKENIAFGNSGYAGVYKQFIYLLNQIMQIRNAISFREKDYIQCPSCHFDTRVENRLGIKDGDDNGAYNIALRGKYLVSKIKKAKNEDKKVKLTFKGDEYFKWIKNNLNRD